MHHLQRPITELWQDRELAVHVSCNDVACGEALWASKWFSPAEHIEEEQIGEIMTDIQHAAGRSRWPGTHEMGK